MKQYKLFKFFNSIEKIQLPLNLNSIKISDTVLAIEYNNSNYEDILKKMLNFNCKQLIITSYIYYDLIKASNKKFHTVTEIDFHETTCSNYQNKIFESLKKIRKKSEKSTNNIEDLLNLLKIYKNSEGIDIKEITIMVNTNNGYDRIKIYNNGVIYTNTEVESIIFELMKTILKGDM